MDVPVRRLWRCGGFHGGRWWRPGALPHCSWQVGAALQPATYNPVRDTISALAAEGADRWVMSGALIGVGICSVVVATGLRPAQFHGRAVLACGGVATCLVATSPQPSRGNSVAHTIAAMVAFVALGAWPIFAGRRGAWAPLLSRTATSVATAILLGLVAWFASEIHGDQRGLAERSAATAQALWPLMVVMSCRRTSARR
jgi:hypothetical membrane protein